MLFYPKEARDDISAVAIVALYQDQWLFIRRRDKKTFEIPGGPVKAGEGPLAAARRILHEESGVLEDGLWPVVCYGSLRGGKAAYGQLYFAHIDALREFSPRETVPREQAERCFLSAPPEPEEDFTVAGLWSELLRKAEKWRVEQRTLLYCVRPADQAGAPGDRQPKEKPGSGSEKEAGLSESSVRKALEGCYLDAALSAPDEKCRELLGHIAAERGLAVRVLPELAGSVQAGGSLSQKEKADSLTQKTTADSLPQRGTGSSLPQQAAGSSLTQRAAGSSLSQKEAAGRVQEALSQILTAEQGRSLVLSLCHETLALILSQYRRDQSFAPGTPGRRQRPRVLRLEFMGDTLIGEQDIWGSSKNSIPASVR